MLTSFEKFRPALRLDRPLCEVPAAQIILSSF
jgi:hypothetical protein